MWLNGLLSTMPVKSAAECRLSMEHEKHHSLTTSNHNNYYESKQASSMYYSNLDINFWLSGTLVAKTMRAAMVTCDSP